MGKKEIICTSAWTKFSTFFLLCICRQGTESYLRSVRHFERQESVESGAHESAENSIRESVVAGTGNRTATRSKLTATRRAADESFAASAASTAGAPTNALVDARARTAALVARFGARRPPATAAFGAPTGRPPPVAFARALALAFVQGARARTRSRTRSGLVDDHTQSGVADAR